jgi:hypothetical protein
MAHRKGRVGWRTRHNIFNRVKYMAGAALNILKPDFIKKGCEAA